MRKIRLIKFALVVILTLAPSLTNAGIDDKPTGAAKGLKKTRHNLSNWGLYDVKATTETQVCIFCHTPHNANSTEAPLWNHQDTTTTPPKFTMASSYYVKPGAPGVDLVPTGISKKCLSCHDGTIAIGALARQDITMAASGRLNGDGTLKSTAPGFIGTDLRSGHVISFNYDDLFQATYSSATKLKSKASMTADERKSMFDRQGRMQCHSCHDPHTDWCDDPNKTVGNDPLWRKTCDGAKGNASVCMVCHRTTFSGYTQAFPW